MYYLNFIYKTIKAYSQIEEYILGKLQGKNLKNKIIEGYLISWEYFNYWKKYSDYEDLKPYILANDYKNCRQIIYKYRKSNRLQKYQKDAIQYGFKSPEDLYKAVKKENKAYVLIDQTFWHLICTLEGLKEKGKVSYSLEKSIITFHFHEFDYCQIITNDNIIDSSKEIKLTGYDVVRKSDKEEKELQKILLLYAYEQELKNKINNLKYKETQFDIYYLISKDWMTQYKKFYHYNEICKIIQKKDELKYLLNKGFAEASKNISEVLKHITFKDNNNKRDFPEVLKDMNTFLCEREDIIINKQFKVSYWKNFEIVNEELINLFMMSEAHGYSFKSSSDAKCLISCGKIIIDLSKDEYNPDLYACEIGTIDNMDMYFNEEYIFKYDNEEAMIDNLSFATQDFLIFQRDYLNNGDNFEYDLLSSEGEVYGAGIKIPP